MRVISVLIITMIVAITSCDRVSTSVPLNTDSLSQVKKLDSLTLNLKAEDFDNFYARKYSVEFDTVLNKRVFLDHYTVVDIKSDSPNYKIELKLNRRFIINLKATRSDIITLNKIIHGDKPPLVFSISDLRKADTNSRQFIANGSLISIN